jgi:hypothetical protein
MQETLETGFQRPLGPNVGGDLTFRTRCTCAGQQGWLEVGGFKELQPPSLQPQLQFNIYVQCSI